MADPLSREELADVVRRLRTALEIQALLRDEPLAAPGTALGSLRAAGRRGAGRPKGRAAARPEAAPDPAPVARRKPAAAARVASAAPARAADAPPPAAGVKAPWQGDPARCATLT